MMEQRNYRRINFRTKADISIVNNTYRCDLIDLALQGALFRSECKLPLQISDQASLSIFLPDSSVRLDFISELIHHRGEFYGFIFISEDAETMGHLCRLLELNFGDSEQANQEFFHWLKRGSND